MKRSLNGIKTKLDSTINKFKNMDNKKNVLMGIIGVLTLLIFVVGATYAYFTAQGGSGANIDTNVITGTTDLISFSFGDEINIQANETNFGQGMGNLSDSTTAQALLRANNTTNSVTTRYNIYLVIESNDFEYTTENGTPEILLNVTDPNGNLVENITGLVHYENGFDITTRTGGFLIVPDYVISAGSTQTVQDWNIEVTFVNLDSDQQANTNKTLTGKIYMTQDTMSSYELTQINNFETSTTYNSITVTPEITAGSGAVEKYYYGIEETTDAMAYNNGGLTRLSNIIAAVEDVEFIESDEPSYTFSNLQDNSTYTVYSYTVDENNIKSNVYSTQITTSEYEIPVINSVNHSVTLNSITVNVTASNGSNSVSKYMYKIGNEEWVETESNSYTFNNLLDTTEYDIRIKVVDSENHESTEYYEAITTEVYILPVVASVNSSTTWNSITLTPSGTNGTNEIARYEYSVNNGAYQTSNVFSNLTENTNYTINVKAIDSAGRESNVYEIQVRTDTYTLPTISVSTSATTNTITVSVNATPGDGSIVSYHYSRDNGSNYTTTSSNSYTFNGLTAGTTYYLRVYVTDSNGRTSSVYTTSQATTYVNPSVSRVTTSNITTNSITINVTASGGSNSISRYYYSNNNGSTWVNSTSSSYTFTGLSASTKYNFKVYVTDTAGHSSSQSRISARTNNETLANYIKGLYTVDGENDLYYHDGVGTYTNSSQEAGDYSYRYSGDNPNNYVCFGSDAARCPTDNLYRIIGVFGNQVKLIKNTSIGANAWDSGNNNTWNATTKPDIYTTLNKTYYNTLGSEWQSLIVESTWEVGGFNYSNMGTPKETYNLEVGTGQNGYEETMKIGLMYVSDYGYAANPSYWTKDLTFSLNNNYGTYDWLFTLKEWLISRDTSRNDWAFDIRPSGTGFGVGGGVSRESVNETAIVRPTFYLASTVEITGGSGTEAFPYRLSVN